MTEPYHYTGCGLDYVYLLNGVTVRDTEYGRGVAIDDASGLHEVIAREVIGRQDRLRGQEVRFLRSLLDLSQAALARVLGTKRLTVARWEAAPTRAIPGPADRALRMFFALKMEGDETAGKLADLLAEMDEGNYAQAVFQERDGTWEHRQAA